MKNILIGHGGAPTSVINASLAGAIKEIKRRDFKGKIYASKFGSAGILKEELIDLTEITDEEIELLIRTPGSAIGTSRFPLYEKEYEQIVDNLIKHDIGYVLFTGGNGSMDTIGNIYKYAKKRNYDITCVGIPKTIDNDIAVLDHAPGFISCAKYIMQTVSDCAQDVKGLPIHVSVIEVMGRNAGWLAASSALARTKSGDAPHIILFPEIPFDEEKFLKAVKEKHEKYGGVIVVASEGLKDKEVITVKNTYINDYLNTNSIKNTGYNNTDDLLRNIKNKSIVVIDKATYDYYKTRKFSDFKVIYEGVLPYNYSFMIRDVNKNKIFSEMFTYYTSSVNYDTIKYKDNTNSKIYEFSLLTTFLLAILVILIIIFLIFFIKKKKENSTIVTNNDKLKYIDTMTSLKNRAYLNLKIKEWDDNVIYPQAFVIIDLNNIKDINDSHGHEEGDTIIKKAASTLIVNQEPNTDIIRTDGNEFLVYMVGYSEKDVISYTRKIYKELKELPYGYGAAIGYSMIMDDIKTVDDAINEATIDMRNKKENNNG